MEGMSNDEVYSSLDEANESFLAIHHDPYIGPLNKDDQYSYDCLLLWIQMLKEEQIHREDHIYSNSCESCGEDSATPSMDNLCADCFWEEDARRKRERRSDPKWRFNRIFSFAHVVEGKSEQEAYTQAVSIFQKEGLSIPV